MGVIQFFGTIVRSDITASSVKGNYTQQTNANHLLIDFNSIVHTSAVKITTEINGFMQIVLKSLFGHRSINNPGMDELFAKYGMTEIQAVITKQTTAEQCVAMFHEHFEENYMDKLVITLVINTVLFLIRTYCRNKDLKTLMLAIDGVPSKGKMIEQKQRRYMSAIIEAYKSKLLNKYKDYLEHQPDNTYIATAKAITWNRNKITPGTAFMHKMTNYLNSDAIMAKFKTNRQQLNVVVSGMYETGEGEKKIVNYIGLHLTDTTDTVMVYSPDADMVLLCMLLPVKKTLFLRHNQQDSIRMNSQIYDLFDIAVLKSNISYYVNNHPSYPKQDFDSDRINRDIVCLSTLFGNDFVPRIETINVSQGFQDIIDAYLDTLIKLKSKGHYLVNEPSKTGGKSKGKSKGKRGGTTAGQYSMNLAFLKLVFNKLLPHEDDFIKHNDLYTKYMDAGYIKNVFEHLTITSENILGIVNEFRSEYDMLKTLIRNGGSVIAYESNDQFMASLRKSIEIRVGNERVNAGSLSNQELFKMLSKQYRATKDFPRLNLNLREYSHSINDTTYRRRLKGKRLNDYEKEKYQFENMLDGYYTKLNAQPLQLTPDKIGSYYKTYFHLDPIMVKNKLTSDAQQVMKHYVQGLLWVFSYYFNDRSYLNTWYYQYERAPLLHHISAFLDGTDTAQFTEIYDGLASYRVTDPSVFFNPVEQLMYVSPMTPEVTALLPSNYRTYIKSDQLDPFLRQYFIDINSITNQLWGDTISRDVDCHSIPYFNKCFIKPLHKSTTAEDKQFLKAIRKVPATTESKRRSQSANPPY
ncbi:5-3 exonuclease [uncultured virus]|nr:5-3 exonuclease [uncultured virus]